MPCAFVRIVSAFPLIVAVVVLIVEAFVLLVPVVGVAPYLPAVVGVVLVALVSGVEVGLLVA